MSNNQYKFAINARNIGPLNDLKFNTNFEKNLNRKVIIYAKNGSGKTMLSKLFNLTNTTPEDLKSYNSNKLISKGANEAEFTFSWTLSSSKDLLTIKLKKDATPIVNNKSNYLYHVFNTDYIKTNVMPNHYALSENIDGHISFVVGKENIEIQKKEQELQEIENTIETIEDEMKQTYNDSIQSLNKYKIDKKTKEYRDFSFNSLFSNEEIDAPLFETVSEQHKKLSSLPEDMSDVNRLTYSINEEDIFQIYDILQKEFLKSSIVEEVRIYITNNFEFIDKGITLYKNKKEICPFCKRPIDKNAKNEIDVYLKYIEDEESKAIKNVRDLKNELDNEIQKLHKLERDFNNIENNYNTIMDYLPQKDNNKLKKIDIVPLITILKTLHDKLDEKSLDVTQKIILDNKTELKKEAEKLSTIINQNNDFIQNLNKTKNKIQESKLYLNRQLCLSMQKKTKDTLKDRIHSINKLKKNITIINIEIQKLKNAIQTSKKDLVAKDFKTHLSYFFANKYIFDEKDFSIMFKDQRINDELEDVLSDGEKSIIAFCHYLASVHTVINDEKDYSKIFFIIDDPISSMDFSYVFCVARLIDTFFKEKLPSKHNPILIFTHNIEFLNILTKNKLVNDKYILSNEKIKPISERLISPYEYHLIDIKNIANGDSSPSHTTANSIRHIIETIWRFVKPDLGDIDGFVSNEEIFKNNDYIVTIINDFSHGGIRIEKSYTDEQIIEACKCVINYINDKFPGQIEQLKKI